MKPWGCHRVVPLPHPWLPIAETACGHDGRMIDERCQGCYRSREESPMDQLDALHALGDVAQAQADAINTGNTHA